MYAILVIVTNMAYICNLILKQLNYDIFRFIVTR